jgi:hypothetical protein
MQRLSITIISVLLLFVCLPGGTVLKASAQNFGYKPSKDDPHYKLRDLAFQYPIQYSPKKITEDKTIFFLRGKEQESLFVSLLNHPEDLQKEIEHLRGKLVSELLNAESNNFKWKQVSRPPTKAGKYDVNQEKWKAFNGKKLLFFEYHHLKVRNKEILVGYAFVMDKQTPEMAEYVFEKGLDAGSGSAGAGSSTIIASITGEGDISVGMPPPGVGPPPPRTKN